MGVSSQLHARILALLASIVVSLLLIGSLWSVLAGAADFGLILQPLGAGEARVQWVAPDGPAWSIGLAPREVVQVPQEPLGRFDAMPRWGMLLNQTTSHRIAVFVPSPVPPFDPLDLAVFVLGFAVLALGILVLMKSADSTAGWAFWRMSLCIEAALAFVPAGGRGILWVLVVQFVALRLAGPSVLALAWAFPARPETTPRHAPMWVWLPACLLLLIYPLCWRWPGALFPAVQVGDGVVLLAYLIGASLLFCLRWWRGRSEPEVRAQFFLIFLGLVGGFAPFLLLTVLPLLVVANVLVPYQVSIQAVVLLPVAVAAAIVHCEFLGITSLVHRRPLRVLVGGVLLVSLGISAWGGWSLVGRAPAWPPIVSAAGMVVLGSALYGLVYPLAAGRMEHLLLRDAYAPAQAVLEVSVALAEATTTEALAVGVVERLGSLLDLSAAWLVGRGDDSHFHHPRSRLPAVLDEAVLVEARRILAGDDAGMMKVEMVGRAPVLLVPIAAEPEANQPPSLVLCLGPKRSGDQFTRRDRAVLKTLAHQITILLHTHALHRELGTRLRELEHLSAERAALAERLISVSEQERRELAAILHDDALQIAGQVERILGDIMAEDHVACVSGPLVREAWKLSHEVSVHLRTVLRTLHPPPLEMAGLVPALETLLRDVGRSDQTHCVLMADPTLEHCRLPAETERILYQIAREGLTNALCHACAQMIEVELRRTAEDGLRLVVRDDGRGFELQSLGYWLATGHLGLALLHERAQEIGGTVHLRSAPNEGTELTVNLPMRAFDTEEKHDTFGIQEVEAVHAYSNHRGG